MTKEAGEPSDRLHETPSWLVILWWSILFVVMLGGAVLCFFADFSLAFAQDPCGNNAPNNPVWICRPQVWSFDLVVPWIGWIVAIVVAVLGMACAKRRKWPILIAAIGAVVVYGGTLFAAFAIALVNYPG